MTTAPPVTERHGDTRARMVSVGAIAVWIGAQIVYPLVEGDHRDVATVVVLCAGFLAMVVDVLMRRGVVRGAVIVASVSAVVYAAEVVGTRTGFPFGDYAYATDRIGPAVADVPVLITAAWFMGAYAVWRVAVLVLARRRALRIAAGVVALVGWDLYLDPQMVAAGLWHWDADASGPPGIEQIPLTNFAGWAVVGLVVMTLFEVLDPVVDAPRADAVPVVPLVWFWWTWLGSMFAQAFLLEDGALRSGIAYGAVAMAVLGVPAIGVAARRYRSPS